MTVSPTYLQELHRLMDRPMRYRFDDFELTTVPSRLTRGGRPIVLQPQPARALELLIRHRGHVVTREMLREHLWGTGAYLDHEQGINFALRKIRIALGDSPSVPRYVETVPRVGYRFVANVEELPVEELQPTTKAPKGEDRSSTPKRLVSRELTGTGGDAGRPLRGHRGIQPVRPSRSRVCRSQVCRSLVGRRPGGFPAQVVPGA